MPLREFTDTTGRQWQAWNTVPGTAYDAASFFTTPRPTAEGGEHRPGDGPMPSGAHVSPGLEQGWLTFQAGDDKRRLSPIPAGWATASEGELMGYLARAAPVHLSDAAARLLGRAERTAEA